MDIIYLLIPVTLVFIIIAVSAFFWAVNSGQYDDLDSPAYLVLFDEENDEKPQDKAMVSNTDKSSHQPTPNSTQDPS